MFLDDFAANKVDSKISLMKCVSKMINFIKIKTPDGTQIEKH
jgi:hypothetical protein